MPLRFIFGLHNHQPVGNFDGVFEQSFNDGYAPFLDLIAKYPEIPFVLHTSGCLMEWLVEYKPEYVDKLREFVARGQVEILGGAFYEPILSMLPRRDRIGQITSYTDYLQNLLRCPIRGMWLAERVWEPELVTDLAKAGIEYTLLDDYHFKQAGLEDDALFNYYLSEDQGQIIKIFPISESTRYLIPWKKPEDAIWYLGEVVAKNPDAVVVCADDGEKFGAWPQTHKHCYTDGWLKKFFDLLRKNLDWIRPCTLAQAVDETRAGGTTYLPDCSYREMTEWALPTPRLKAYNEMVANLAEGDPAQGFLRGGFWRNFKAKYPEVHEMYCKMLEVSDLVDSRSGKVKNIAQARTELFRGQCNCSFWHGAFGGLYLPHLRNAVYQHLIKAENIAQPANRKLEAVEKDFNLDTQPEIKLRTPSLAAYFSPSQGGAMYELDVKDIAHNLLATLARRPEAYHDTILQATGVGNADDLQALHERVKFKQEGLEKLLHYDKHPRKSLIDHFYARGVTLEKLQSLGETELGDFLSGPYSHEINQNKKMLRLDLSRNGKVGDILISVAKSIELDPNSDGMKIRYDLSGLPKSQPTIFAVEFNFAGMAAGADDRYFYFEDGKKAGQLQTTQDRKQVNMIGLRDEWLGLDAALSFSRPTDIWAFPIQTVSQSEGGFELVHQSTAVLPHWPVGGEEGTEFEINIEFRITTS